LACWMKWDTPRYLNDWEGWKFYEAGFTLARFSGDGGAPLHYLHLEVRVETEPSRDMGGADERRFYPQRSRLVVSIHDGTRAGGTIHRRPESHDGG